MKTQDIKGDWPHLEENEPPLDLTRENAAFERERSRLVRDYLGQIALIHGDEVVGAYPTYREAIAEALRRFGRARIVCRPITEEDAPEFIPQVDVKHPSFRRTP